jgi:hypothetical protein
MESLHVCFFCTLVCVFCKSHSWLLGGGGETSWQGTSWGYCLSSEWVWWNSLFRNFCFWHMYKCPLVLCLITSHCHSQHCCLKLTDAHLHQYRTLIRMWVRCPHLSLVATRVLCHIISSLCLFIYNHISFHVFKQQLMVK